MTDEAAAREALENEMAGRDCKPLLDTYRTAIEERVRREDTWKAHRPVSGIEADNENGKIHGYCIRCIRPWPCEYSPEWKEKADA